MGFTSIKGEHVNPHQHKKRAPNAKDCPTGGMTSPKNNQVVDSLEKLNITWNPSCFTSSSVDIYLFGPKLEKPRLHLYQGVSTASGAYMAELMPRWWGANPSVTLQLTIVASGNPSFFSGLSAGPVFSATYKEPASGKPASADLAIVDNSSVTPVGTLGREKKMNPGKTAAAVIFPLLIVLGLLGYWIRRQRMKGKDKRQEWKEAVDKRMSTISTDWKSISAAGATAAIRNSMAVNRDSAVGNRGSMAFGFGNIRPQSTVAVEGEEIDEKYTRPKSQMRPGVGLRNPVGTGVGYGAQAERQSRISFADGTRFSSRVSVSDNARPSFESGKSQGTTRAFKDDYMPPLPANAALLAAAAAKKGGSSSSSDDGTTDSGVLSPRQTAGALPLTTEDIKNRVGAGRKSEEAVHGGQEHYADVLPALSMVRTQESPTDPDFIFDVPPTPAPAAAHYKSSRNGSYERQGSFDHPFPTTDSPRAMSPTIQPVPASVMSPDDLLRAYAEQRKRNSSSTSGASSPPPAFPGSIFASATPIHHQLQQTQTRSASPRASHSGGLLQNLTAPLKRKKSHQQVTGKAKFGQISSPVISYPTLAAGSGATSDVGAPPVPGERRDQDAFGGPSVF